MSKTTGGIVAIVVVVLAILGYLATRPYPGGGGGKLIDVADPIQGDGTGPCTLSKAPVSLNTGNTVTWSDDKGLSYTVVFPAGTNVNPGTPFTNPLIGSRQTNFASTGAPLQTGGASMTYWQKFWGENEFPILSISVNGQECYNKNKNPLPGMKVIINQ
jgi:hypothetical protein